LLEEMAAGRIPASLSEQDIAERAERAFKAAGPKMARDLAALLTKNRSGRG
jgi:hypothetical protein